MKSLNKVTMAGRLYDFRLEEGTDRNGTPYIKGEVDVEVDGENGTVATLRYYATPQYKNGKVNTTYNILQAILNGDYNTVATSGDSADWITAQEGNIDISYFAPREGAKTVDDMSRSQKLRGSFLSANNKKVYTNSWKVDFLITNVAEVEEDAEKKISRYAKVSGYIVDDYNERLMEARFVAMKPAAINYVLGLVATVEAPHYVSTWGRLTSVVRSIVRQNAFGEAETEEYVNTQWEITGMSPDAYEFTEEVQNEYTVLANALAEHIAEKFNESSADGNDPRAELDF